MTAPPLLTQWAKPNFGVTIGAVTAATATSPQQAYHHNDNFTIPTGPGSFAETFRFVAMTEGLSAEAARFVKLGWQADGIDFNDTWVDKN